jgi:hypothetical protein
MRIREKILYLIWVGLFLIVSDVEYQKNLINYPQLYWVSNALLGLAEGFMFVFIFGIFVIGLNNLIKYGDLRLGNTDMYGIAIWLILLFMYIISVAIFTPNAKL